MQNVILSVPDSLDVLQQDGNGDFLVGNDVIAQINAVSGEWPDGGIMPGTQPANSKKLIHALVDIDAANPLVALEVLVLAYELDWVIEAMQEVMPTQEVQEVDGENVLVNVPVVYKAVPQSLLDYIPDIVTYDEEGNETSRERPTIVPQLHQYVIQGQAQWMMK